MDEAAAISAMKRQLLHDVAALCRRADRQWSQPIVHTLRELRNAKVHGVFFGGTLRSLLLSRLWTGRFGRPRDVDIVVVGASLDELRDRFRYLVKRETRFGGLQLERMSWHFDIWPLDRTWAFQNRAEGDRGLSDLPMTTVFNLEAIAVDVWAAPGQPRSIYSADDQFFRGILARTIELNNEDNPFPALCVVRALVFAASTGFAIGPRLTRYLAHQSALVSDDELVEVQRTHYSFVRKDAETLRRWLDLAAEHIAEGRREPLALPKIEQLSLWEDDDQPKVFVNVLRSAGGREQRAAV